MARFFRAIRYPTMSIRIFLLATVTLLIVAACGGSDAPTAEPSASSDDLAVNDAELEGNPFRAEWTTPFAIPPFDIIESRHYLPALKKGALEYRAEVAAVAGNPEPPTFENTIIALEAAGDSLDKVIYTFVNIRGTEMDDVLREVESEIMSTYTRVTDAVYLDDALFERVQAVYAERESLDLRDQDARLLQIAHRDFVRAGAALDPASKQRVADINGEIAGLETTFAQNLLAATVGFELVITDAADLTGLAEAFKASLWDEERSAWVVGLSRSEFETFMTQSENRDLRRQLFDGYRLRASAGTADNGPALIRIAQLRAERARLMGYESHAHYQTETRMAKSPQGAEDFLLRVWQPGLAQAKRERADLQSLAGDAITISGEDWWHYSERVRQDRYAFDDNALKPYFELGAVRGGAFELANRLFGLTFERVDVPVWHPTVTAWDVQDAAGAHLGILFIDVYARDTKRGGAWMNNYRESSNINGNSVRPLVTMNLNLTMPPEGQPTLLRFSEVVTFFHEFGHGMHGIMTQIDYATFSGVYGPRDYTEFPAQILEHWPGQPQMLGLFATHYENGDVIPQALIEKMRAATNFNQGFKTTEYIAASLLDLRWHMLTVEQAAAITDARAFEERVLREYGLIDEIEPRYRSQTFRHIFASGYSAGYYAYLWSEILDADGFDAFRQAEDIFDPELAARLKRWIYESGGLREADELYREFRGDDPSIEPLLRGRGFPTED